MIFCVAFCTYLTTAFTEDTYLILVFPLLTFTFITEIMAGLGIFLTHIHQRLLQFLYAFENRIIFLTHIHQRLLQFLYAFKNRIINMTMHYNEKIHFRAERCQI